VPSQDTGVNQCCVAKYRDKGTNLWTFDRERLLRGGVGGGH
jgi:hypothetical protein